MLEGVGEAMSTKWYRAQDVIRCLYEHNCEYAGDRFEIGMVWLAPDGMPFTLPRPQEGWFEVTVVEEILSDRSIWLCTAPRYDR